jgi:hypothetical protein
LLTEILWPLWQMSTLWLLSATAEVGRIARTVAAASQTTPLLNVVSDMTDTSGASQELVHR